MLKIVFYHGDADGVLSALFYAMNNGDSVYIPINYDLKALDNVEIDCETTLVFLDFNLASMDAERLKNLVWHAHRVIVHDHHAGTEEKTLAKIESNDLIWKYTHYHHNIAICKVMLDLLDESQLTHDLITFTEAIAERDIGGAWDESVSFLEREMMKQIHHAFYNSSIFEEMTRERSIEHAISQKQMKKFFQMLASINFELLHKERLMSYADMIQEIMEHDFEFFKLAFDSINVVYVDASEEDIDISELGNYFTKMYKMPCIIKTKHKNKYSVRSCDLCSKYAKEIAQYFGGGGHRHAAGFSHENFDSDAKNRG